MKEKTVKTLIVIIALLTAASLCILLFFGGKEGGKAVITFDGKVIEEIDLAKAEDKIISIKEKAGVNVSFEVKDGAIRFLSSDCPDKICVKSGFLSHKYATAACLPNKVALSVQ